MSAGTTPVHAAAGRLAPLAAWWRGLAARERRAVVLAAAVLGAYLLWAIALQPALRTLRGAPAQHERLDAALAEMQRGAAEARELRALPPVDTAQAQAALKAATERLGEQGQLAITGERAVLTLRNARTEALLAWLAEVRSGARARPVEANLQRGPTGTSGTLVVAIGGGA